MGQAVSAVDPLTGKETLFMDYRHRTAPGPAEFSHITDWQKVDLKAIARQYASANSGARFALLRVWSHPNFWPCMVGVGSRWRVAFTDCVGRYWTWKFYPKEMPGESLTRSPEHDI